MFPSFCDNFNRNIHTCKKKKYSMNQYIKNKIQNLSFKICHVILPGEILQPDKLEGIFRKE